MLSDKTFIIRCVYGSPEISQLDIPIINPSFNAVTLAFVLFFICLFVILHSKIHFHSSFRSLKVIQTVILFCVFCFYLFYMFPLYFRKNIFASFLQNNLKERNERKLHIFRELSTKSVQDESFDAIGSSNEGSAESQDMDDNDDNTIISWPILLSTISGLFVVFLILMFAFVFFRWKIDSKPRNSQQRSAPSNGLPVDNLFGKFRIFVNKIVI